jgi:amino acid transporter
MIRTTVFRRIVGIVAVALALGAIAGPASARTFDFNANGSLVLQPPPSMPAPSTPAAANPASGGSSIDWGYVAIGSSVVALALIGVGAVATGRRRSRKDTPQRATIAG